MAQARQGVREYLAFHGIEAVLRDAVAKVVEDRPPDPILQIGRLLLDTAPSAQRQASEPLVNVAAPQSHDPRGLVDTTPGEVDPAAAQRALELSEGSLSSSLTDLNLKKAGLSALPPQIGRLTNLTKLDVSLSPLHGLPAEMSELSSLRIFFALGARFTSVPMVLGELPSLYMLSFKSNQLTHIADGALAPTLEWLILTDNQLTALPKHLPRGLRKVMLTNNRLTQLPESIVQCRELELIRLSDNQLSSLPDGFLTMPKLTWLALAGNPILRARSGTPPLAPPRWIPHDHLDLGEQIGAGGGGFVHRAAWRAGGSAPPVPCAVKLFRGSGTVTDGDPAHEIDLGEALSHPNVIQVLGACPAPKLGLVLELLDVKTAWTELGRPPNFDTCTRDTYADGTTFEFEQVVRTLRGVARACTHLHSRGFTHGDLYAHNTLVNSDGDAKVGDFGASFQVTPLGDEAAWLLERLEARAFGCMASELYAHLSRSAFLAPCTPLAQLQAIVTACMAPDVRARPSFATISARLDAL